MVNDSIQRSRRGIAYQDRYTLLKFLEYFQEGRLVEFYTDHPFDEKGHSLDIFAVLMNPKEEHIFEIKTGERFKRDKTQKLGDELHTLYEFSHNRGRVSKVALVVDPEIPAEILRNWSDLQIIKDRNGGTWGGETYRQILERCQKQFNFTKMSIEVFKDFIKKIEFRPGPPNIKQERERLSPLETLIIQEIRRICDRAGSSGAEIEMPYSTTVQELLDLVRYGAEYGRDIACDIIEVLTGSFARRKFVEKWIDNRSGLSRDEEIRKLEPTIMSKLIKEYQPSVINVRGRDSILENINQIIQSGQYSKNREVILDFFKDEELKSYFSNKLPDSLEDLAEVEFILEELVKDERPFKLIRILKDSSSERNIEFILNFISEHYQKLG